MRAQVVDTTREDPPRPHWTTIGAGLLVLAVTSPFVWAGVRIAQVAWGDRLPRSDARTVNGAFGNLVSADVETWYAIAAIVTFTFSAWCVMLGFGLLARREWARYGAVLTFLGFGIVLAALMVGGAINGGEAPNRWMGVLVALGEVAIVVLLLLRQTADDIETANWFRDRRRAREREVREFRRALAPVQPEDFA